MASQMHIKAISGKDITMLELACADDPVGKLT
jgi:hypothetical protein